MKYEEFIKVFSEKYNLDFASAVFKVLQFEGGISDDAEDKGGFTKYGISERFFKSNIEKLRSLGIVKQSESVADLSLSQVVDIYYHMFWKLIKCDEYDLAFVKGYMFDMAVNMGVGGSAMLLQQALNNVGNAGLKVDGAIGAKTLLAYNRLNDTEKTELKLELIKLRVEKYVRIGLNESRFLYGWVKRAFGWNGWFVDK